MGKKTYFYHNIYRQSPIFLLPTNLIREWLVVRTFYVQVGDDCTGRQIKFEVVRSNKSKIGMNTLSNKFYYITKMIGLDSLNLKFVHYKKIMKIQFLKNGRTWNTANLTVWLTGLRAGEMCQETLYLRNDV